MDSNRTPNDSDLNGRLTMPEYEYMTSIVPCMDDRRHIPVIRTFLERAKNEGLNWRKIYAVALKGHPKGWRPAPTMEEVAPE